MSNTNLKTAKKSKNDEFYTLMEDIEKEMRYYKDFFKGKVVYCNCDDARESNFFKYFSLNFEFLGLKKLISTGYKADGKGVVLVYEGDKKFVAALPYDGLRVTFTSMNPHPLLGCQTLDVILDEESYRKEISPARTIGFTWELEAMRKMGLGKGGTLENAVVYSEDKCLSKLRFQDELVRHKILDILGDISLVGPLEAHIIAVLGSEGKAE